jgi:gluconolactonase
LALPPHRKQESLLMERRRFLNLAAAATATMALEPATFAADSETRNPVHYPDPAIEIVDPLFAKCLVGNAAIERLYTGCRWAEGPVWFGDGRYLLWSDIPNNRMLRWLEDTGEVSVFRQPANYSNGNTRDRLGHLVTCEHDSRRVTRTEYDGTITVMADHYQGKPFNAPNDLAVHSDGAVWFTDPGYGTLSNYEGHKAAQELPANVYRMDPKTSALTVVATDMEKPNGICFSPDEKKLYVVDTGFSHHPGYPKQIRVYDVVDRVKLASGRIFVDTGKASADGIRCDIDGNVWSGMGWGGPDLDGVQVFAPDGKLIGKIHLPEVCANLCFGGAKRNRLFMAASQSLYALYVDAQGAQVP